MWSLPILSAILAATIQDAPIATVQGLRCEYRVDPIGIGEPNPRLSWTVAYSGRNWHQSAYRIVVASSAQQLKSKPDLYDTGKVESSESNQIPYQGQPLRSNQMCYWRVQVWDESGRSTNWSPTGQWQMGLLDESDWGGSRWIGGTSDKSPAPAPFLRRSFEISKGVRRATLYACGLGYSDLHLNGKPVNPGGEREPGYTNFDKRVLYTSEDVTKLLHPGRNALACVLGTGWYDVHDLATWRFEQAAWRARPRLRLLLEVEYRDGRREDVVSDGNWKTAEGPIRFDGIYTGEVYDARLEQKGWDSPEFDDHTWQPVRLVEAPKGKLVSRICPGVVITESFAPKAITEPKPGVYVVDFGQNLSGHVQLRLQGPAGAKVTMRYSERLDSKGMIDRTQIEALMTKTDPPQPFQTDAYICRGEGEETWEQRFSYSGFRYIEVTGFPGTPTADNFRARFAHTGLESAGGFECSNELLNKIQHATRYSYLSNAQSIPTDCPQREKNGWTGDAHLAAEAGLMNFRSETFYTKWLDDLADDQDGQGKLGVIVPTGGWGWGDFNPAWDSAYPIVASDLYRYSGDTRVLERHFEPIRRYVDALAAEAKNGVLEFDSLGDWVPWSTQTPSQLTSTAFLYLDSTMVSRMAKLLGKTDDAAKYADLAQRTKVAFNHRFYDPATGLYSNGSQAAMSTALYFGLVPDDQKERVFDALVADVQRQGHIDTGIIGAKNVLRVLSEGGRSDLAYMVVARKEQPGWGWWMEQGATTLWEDWKGEFSLNHIMFGDVSNWFIQWIAGIGLDSGSPGFRHVRIQPQPVADLTWAKAWHDSPYGRIESSWRIEKGRFTLDVTIPPNCSATVLIPRGIGTAKLDGKSGSQFEVGSGAYRFVGTNPI
jgi:alpha-L-rhamnosidase